jgi:hypothetical protein
VILIKVELHSAVTGKVTEIGRAHIFNDGAGDRRSGSYGARFMRRGTTDTVQREAKIPKHGRLSQSIWVLVRKAVVAAGY